MLTPLSEVVRPDSLENVVGQEHLLGNHGPLKNMIECGHISNLIFYGPPGVGKTTVARIIAKKSGMPMYTINGTSSSSSEIKNIINESQTLYSCKTGILIYIDEIQYFNKKQQQTLLESIENGSIKLIASTTENPHFFIYGSLLSRCIVFEFKHLNRENIRKRLTYSLDIIRKQLNVDINISEKCIDKILDFSIGDARKAINILEFCVSSAQSIQNSKTITEEMISNITQRKSSYFCNSQSDEYYDLLSAFQKSMRGSDSDAAVYYLARLLYTDNIVSVCRRLLVCTCEDVGLAYPQLIPIIKTYVDIALQVGMPEARIPLSNAVILVCNAPKSNSAYKAINKALEDIENGKVYPVPDYLRSSGDNSKYRYPHNFKDHWVKQSYMPKEINNNIYYTYGDNKYEQTCKVYNDKIKNK